MKKNYFLFALLGAGFCIQNPVMASEVSGNESVKVSAVMPVADVPQTVKPFKGQWYSDEIYMDIDFYGNTVSDPNSMDGDPCPGIIKVRKGGSEMSYTILSMKINGKKASGIVSDNDFQEQPMSAEILADGTMKITIPALKLIMGEGDIKVFKGEKILRKAAPFAGKWSLKGNGITAEMILNLYDRCIMGMNADMNDALSYGIINITMGMNVDDCSILSWEGAGNTVDVKFVSSRSGGIYKAKLTYLPSTKKIKVSQVTPVGSDAGECYLTDGMEFVY